jgi:chromate transporter
VASPSLSAVFRAWLLVGLRSFGGGPATLFLIRRSFVEESGWVTPEQFTRDWALCQLAPGINLLALTILIGRRLHGWRGIVLGLIGLLIPSALCTVLITAFYAEVQHAPAVRSALRGVVPATVGVGLAAAFGMLKPPLEASRREGRLSLALAYMLLGACALAALRYRTAVFPILLAAGAAGAAFQLSRRTRPAREERE